MSAFPLRLSCPQCKAEVHAKREQIGMTVTCPECLEEFPVCDPASPSASRASVADRTPSVRLDGEDLRLQPDEDHAAVGDGPLIRRPEIGLDAAVGGATDALGDDYEFDFECRVCGTRQDATSKQIGKRIRCPDCHSMLVVQAPPRRARRKRTVSTPRSADELRLGEPVEAAPFRGLAKEMLETASKEVSRDDAARALARQTLQRAEKQAAREEAARPRLPERPLTTGILRPLFEPTAVSRCLGFAVLLQLELGAISWAANLFAQDHPISQFICAMMVVLSVILGAIAFAVWSVSMLAIVQETAAGKDRIETWPTGNFTDWFLEAFYVITSLFVSVLAGTIVGQVFLPLAGGSRTVYLWGLVICSSLMMLAVFPVAIMSSLEAGSPFNFLSRPVWRSLRLTPRRWVQFWTMSAGLTVTATVVFEGRRVGSIVVNYLVAVVIVALSMVYFRLLGRLTWCCQEAVANEQCRKQTSGKTDEDGGATS